MSAHGALTRNGANKTSPSPVLGAKDTMASSMSLNQLSTNLPNKSIRKSTTCSETPPISTWVGMRCLGHAGTWDLRLRPSWLPKDWKTMGSCRCTGGMRWNRPCRRIGLSCFGGMMRRILRLLTVILYISGVRRLIFLKVRFYVIIYSPWKHNLPHYPLPLWLLIHQQGHR